MSTNLVHSAWQAWIEQFAGNARVTFRRRFADMAMALWQSKSVHLSKAALEVEGTATVASQARRFMRFLDSPSVVVEAIYVRVVCWWLTWLLNTQQELVLIVDGTRVTTRHQLLLVGVDFKRRVIPLAWAWRTLPRGHCSAAMQIALFTRVYQMLAPAQWARATRIVVVGDSEFGPVEVMQHVHETYDWHYVLRQKSNNQVQAADAERWQPFENLVTQAGSKRWLPAAQLTRKHCFTTNLLAFWGKGEKECWLLATSLPSSSETLACYRLRMHIEGFFGDLKGNGFQLEHSRLHHVHRLNFLTLVVCLLYIWSIRSGLFVELSGNRRMVDRNDRRDLSYFRLGWSAIKNRLTNNKPILVLLCPDEIHEQARPAILKLSGS